MQACVSGRAQGPVLGITDPGKQFPRVARAPWEAWKTGSATDTILIAMSISNGRVRWDRSSLLMLVNGVVGLGVMVSWYHFIMVSWCHGAVTVRKMVWPAWESEEIDSISGRSGPVGREGLGRNKKNKVSSIEWGLVRSCVEFGLVCPVGLGAKKHEARMMHYGDRRY